MIDQKYFPYEFILTSIQTPHTAEEFFEIDAYAHDFHRWLIKTFGKPRTNYFGLPTTNDGTWIQLPSKFDYIYGFQKKQDAALCALFWSNGSSPAMI